MLYGGPEGQRADVRGACARADVRGVHGPCTRCARAMYEVCTGHVREVCTGHVRGVHGPMYRPGDLLLRQHAYVVYNKMY